MNSADRAKENRDYAIRVLRETTDLQLEKICRRGERVVKGSRFGESGPNGKGSVSDPTASVALAVDVRDPVGDYIADLFSTIAKIAGQCSHARGLTEAIMQVEAEERGRVASGGNCMACGAWCSGASDDRLRGGFCNKCRMAWERFSRRHPHADRSQFIRERRGAA